MQHLTKERSVLSLSLFNGMVSTFVEKADAEKPKGKILDVEPPDPTGKKSGRKRDSWKIRTEAGEYYSPSKPEGIKDPRGKEEGAKRGQAAPVDERKGPAKPKILSDIKGVTVDLKNEKISMDQAKSGSSEIASRIKRKSDDLKGSGASPEDNLKITEASTRAQAAVDAAGKAEHADDREGMSEALNTLNSIAEDLQSVIENISAEGGKKVEGKKGDSEGKRSYLYEKAALSTAPWEGKIAEIEKALTGNVAARETSSAGSANGVFFETSESGERGVFKPDDLSVGIDEMRTPETFNPKVGSAAREVATFELDRMLGLGIVPPTFEKEETGISSDDRAKVVKYLNDKSVNGLEESTKRRLVAAAQEGKPLKGSTQLMVDGVPATDDDHFEERYDADEDFKFSLQSMAVLDYFAGASDRHRNNIMVSSDGKSVYAIDNGLNFSKTNPDNFEDIQVLDSMPIATVLTKSNGKVDSRIVDQIKGVDTKAIKLMMSKHGMSNESIGVVARIEEFKKTGTIPNFRNNYAYVREAKIAERRRASEATRQEVVAELRRISADLIEKDKGKKQIIDIVVGTPEKKKVIGTFAFDGRKVHMVKGEGNPYMAVLKARGVRGRKGKVVTMLDGEEFVENLPLAISGSYVRAVQRG